MRALGRRCHGVGAASGDVVQSSARDVVPDDRPLGPHYRGREVEFRRRLVLLLNRQGPGEPRRRPPAQVVVNHVGHYFDRRRVLHFASVLAAVVADQVGAFLEPLTEYLQARGPVFRLDLRDRYDGGRTNGNDLWDMCSCGGYRCSAHADSCGIMSVWASPRRTSGC